MRARNLHVTGGKEEDIEAIKKIADSTLKRHFWMSWTTKDIFRADRKVVVCKIGKEIGGFAIGSKRLNRGYLLAVVANHQGQGIGKKLANEFQEWNVLRSALPFFTHIGFRGLLLVRKSTKGAKYDTFRLVKAVR